MSTDFEPSMFQRQGGEGPHVPRWVLPASYAVLGIVGLVSAYQILSAVYGFSGVGFLVVLGAGLVGGLVGFGLTFLPLGPSGYRKIFRWLSAGLWALIALWALHAGPYGEASDRREASAAITGAASVADAHARLQAISASNPYAAYALHEIRRRAETRGAIKAIFDQVQSDKVPWGLDFDPADKAGLQALRSRLLDIDVLLSGVPDQVVAQLQKERADLNAAAERLELSEQFRAEMQQTMAQRQKELGTFYVALAVTTRKAAGTIADITVALLGGKATRGTDGKFAYGDDATRAKVEPLIAQLGEARGVIAKLAEAAKALDQRYGDGSTR
ncbi:MAG: hypothetical protein OJI70_04960 [Zavarzinia sp.]|nr:hypothetical protein [Zavarzinia sp.]